MLYQLSYTPIAAAREVTSDACRRKAEAAARSDPGGCLAAGPLAFDHRTAWMLVRQSAHWAVPVTTGSPIHVPSRPVNTF